MKVLKLMALVATLLVTACGDDRFPDYHYKITIYVGDKAFSSVRAVEAKEVSSIVDSSGRTVKTSQRGEAVILDLGSGQVVYALLSGADSNSIGGYGFATVALTPHIPGKPTVSDMDQAIKEYRDDQNPGRDGWDERAEEAQQMVQVQGPQDLPRTYSRPGRAPMKAWPMFVTFDDPKDPKTVREVSPGSIGVSRITVEITDEPVTTGIEARLPDSFWQNWAERRRQQMRQDGGIMNNPYFDSFESKLTKDVFIVGED